MDGWTEITVSSSNDRSKLEVWQSVLGHIPTLYGRLVYLATLRNVDTGVYEHFGLNQDLSASEAHAALLRLHELSFRTWVEMSLEGKMADIQLYIASLPQVATRDLVEAWARLTPYRNLVPASVLGPERSKHVSDFEVILGLLQNVYGVALPDPNA